MKLQVVLVPAALLFFSGLALADEPPSWSKFESASANGRFRAEVRVKEKSAGTNPWDSKYQLSVFEVSRQSGTPIWSCDYDYDGYPDGMLSDDGSTFVYVNSWYYADSPAVSVYHNGKKVGILRGQDFKIAQSKLRRSASHELWLDESEMPHARFVSTPNLPLALEVRTIDKNIHLIDVASAKILK